MAGLMGPVSCGIMAVPAGESGDDCGMCRELCPSFRLLKVGKMGISCCAYFSTVRKQC